jgi:hypothetical protein
LGIILFVWWKVIRMNFDVEVLLSQPFGNDVASKASINEKYRSYIFI